MPASSTLRPGGARRLPSATQVRAADLLHRAREQERAGCTAEAKTSYNDAIAEAGRSGEWAIQAEALRRLGALQYFHGQLHEAREACERSLVIASENGDSLLAAEALNARGIIEMEGNVEAARGLFLRALELGGSSVELRARVEQNLGVLANMQGQLDEALLHYGCSLQAYREANNEHGCALAYHNLGMLSADREQWEDAERHFEESRVVAERIGDLHLQGMCLLNRSEVHIARQRYEEAKHGAEEALALFDQLGAARDKSDAYRVIGVVFRETGRTALGESRLRSAIDLAAQTGSVLYQAEASRELALLYQGMGRNQEALALLTEAHGLFGRLDARADLVDVGGKMARLEEAFLAVVRDWGRSIESSDTYTFGHSERVASYAAAVAEALGLDAPEVTTVRLGAYLHDVGKIRIPHEVLNKPGRLSADEFDVVKMHPIWGLELLEGVEFPWDIKPIIRWHHEKLDGTGYPDRLRGEEIPLNAMIIGIVDVFDALTTTRSYRPALSLETALAEMQRSRHWWKPEVYEAFCRAIPARYARGEFGPTELASGPAAGAAA